MGHCRLCGPGGTFWAGGMFWAGVGGMGRAPSAQDNNGPASMVERGDRATGETAGGGTANSSGKLRLSDNSARHLGPLHRGLGYESRRVLLFCPDLRLFPKPIPAPGIVALATAVANSRRFAVSQRSPWPAGGFLRDGEGRRTNC